MRRRILRWLAPLAMRLLGWAAGVRSDDRPPSVLCLGCHEYLPIPDDVLEGRAGYDAWMAEHVNTVHGTAP